MPTDHFATLYRMVLPDHTCPFGVKAKALLTEHGYEVDDRELRTREAVDAFETKHGVRTTPLVFIGDRRIGGCDELERHLLGPRESSESAGGTYAQADFSAAARRSTAHIDSDS